MTINVPVNPKNSVMTERPQRPRRINFVPGPVLSAAFAGGLMIVAASKGDPTPALFEAGLGAIAFGLGVLLWALVRDRQDDEAEAAWDQRTHRCVHCGFRSEIEELPNGDLWTVEPSFWSPCSPSAIGGHVFVADLSARRPAPHNPGPHP